jgi:hypothetical protein
LGYRFVGAEEMGSVITIDTTCHFSQFLKNKIGNGSFFTC